MGKKISQNLLDKVTKHVIKMKVKVNSTERKCVDGGYKSNEAKGAISFAGGDLGLSMALLNFGFSPQKSFDLVYEFVKSKGQNYCWHSDTHEGHNECIIGCGHCNSAIKNSKYYLIDSENILKLFRILKNAQENFPNMKEIILDREHNEQGVLIIESDKYTVMPWDEINNIQYFIYDIIGHKNYLKNFIKFCEFKKIEISYDKLLDVFNIQTDATLGLLTSSKGKPIYIVRISDEEKIEINYLKNAPVFDN